MEGSVESQDLAIQARACSAGRVASLLKSDRRVARCRRIDFAEDGGAVVGVELAVDASADRATVAHELELELRIMVPALPWVRVAA